MRPHTGLATLSRDSYQALRRVERQQVLVERLSRARGRRIPLADLARDHRVSVRTIARDVERLRSGGLPLSVRRGRGGGVSLASPRTIAPIAFDLPEVAALISSLAAVGPTVSDSAGSAMRKLAAAVSDSDGRVATPEPPTIVR